MSSDPRAFIIISLCVTSACLGVFTNAYDRTRFAFGDLVRNTTRTVGGPFLSLGNLEAKSIDRGPAGPGQSTCGWKAPYACGCSNDDFETMRRRLWNPTALELLNAGQAGRNTGLGQAKYTNYTFLQVHEAGFEELRRRLATFFEDQRAVNISCEEVVIKVSIFPKTPLSGRRPLPMEHRIMDTYTGPRGCGIYVMSDWQIEAKKSYGWNTVAFPTDEFVSNLTKIGNQSISNELSNEFQRFFNLVKIAVIFLVPSSVKKVSFCDWKCYLIGFQQVSAWSNRSNISDFEVLLHGSHFNKSLMTELAFNHGHLLGRREWTALRDIDRLKLFIGPNVTKLIVNMPDIMCTTWHLGRNRQALARFALRWFWFTAAFTMRPQLTFNLAMFDCGESLAVNYFKKNW